MNRGELLRLMPDEPYRFRMDLRAVAADAFLRERSADAARHAEKRGIFAHEPARASVTDDSAPQLAEALAWLGHVSARTEPANEASPWMSAAREVGPDLLLVRRSGLRLVAIAVAFPSGWAPEVALGRRVDAIHAIVPGLSDALEARIARFLTTLREGEAFARSNWGLCTSEALDRHPRHARAPLNEHATLEDTRLRIEEQAFIGLGSCVLFAVHPVHVPLATLASDPELAARLATALRTMPADVARYKGLESARETLAKQLDQAR